MRLFGLRRSLPRRVVWKRPWDFTPAPPDAFVSAEFRKLHPVDLNFNHCWQLAGVRFLEEEGRFTLGMRWRCLESVSCWLRCFARVQAVNGVEISEMDHDLLDGDPPPAEWVPGDEGYEVRYLERVGKSKLRLASGGYEVAHEEERWRPFRLVLGLYDTGRNVRLPLVVSTLPVVEEGTAAVVIANTEPAAENIYRFEPAPAEPCRVRFAGGLELAACSATRNGDRVWVRLEWNKPRVQSPVRFFGHAVRKRGAGEESLASFDQDLFPSGRSAAGRLRQDIVRTIPAGMDSVCIRAGVCTSGGLERLRVEECSLESDEQARCFYIPVVSA